MNNYIDQLTKSLLKKESLEQCSVQELRQLASEYPYFGAAQLLLAKKLQVENSEDYEAQVKKTSLFFNNPLWFDHLLNEKGNVLIEKSSNEELTVSLDEVKEPVLEEIRSEATIVSPAEVDDAMEPVFEEIRSETKIEIPGQADDVNELVIEEIKPGATLVTPAEANTGSSVREKSFIPEKEQPFNANTELLFEPYHTVDYFASQGIKFKEEEKPADKLGQQLKSFTEWLKTLKRLPVSEIIKSSEPIAEKKVELMAEASLAEREVVTETMAEVWKKQGNKEKAIEIYNKLSLLEPSKNAYFAAKIDELKNNF